MDSNKKASKWKPVPLTELAKDLNITLDFATSKKIGSTKKSPRFFNLKPIKTAQLIKDLHLEEDCSSHNGPSSALTNTRKKSRVTTAAVQPRRVTVNKIVSSPLQQNNTRNVRKKLQWSEQKKNKTSKKLSLTPKSTILNRSSRFMDMKEYDEYPNNLHTHIPRFSSATKKFEEPTKSKTTVSRVSILKSIPESKVSSNRNYNKNQQKNSKASVNQNKSHTSNDRFKLIEDKMQIILEVMESNKNEYISALKSHQIEISNMMTQLISCLKNPTNETQINHLNQTSKNNNNRVEINDFDNEISILNSDENIIEIKTDENERNINNDEMILDRSLPNNVNIKKKNEVINVNRSLTALETARQELSTIIQNKEDDIRTEINETTYKNMEINRTCEGDNIRDLEEVIYKEENKPFSDIEFNISNTLNMDYNEYDIKIKNEKLVLTDKTNIFPHKSLKENTPTIRNTKPLLMEIMENKEMSVFTPPAEFSDSYKKTSIEDKIAIAGNIQNNKNINSFLLKLVDREENSASTQLLESENINENEKVENIEMQSEDNAPSEHFTDTDEMNTPSTIFSDFDRSFDSSHEKISPSWILNSEFDSIHFRKLENGTKALSTSSIFDADRQKVNAISKNISSPDISPGSKTIYSYNEIRRDCPFMCTPKITKRIDAIMTPSAHLSGHKLLSRKIQEQLFMLNVDKPFSKNDPKDIV